MSATMNWKDPTTRVKFLMSVLASNDSAVMEGGKATQIAGYMGCTAKAVTHQLTALRKDVSSIQAENPVSGVAGKGTSKGGSSATKRKVKDTGLNGLDGTKTPSKKAKATAKKTTTKAKNEASSEEDEDSSIAARKDAAEGRGSDSDKCEDED